MNKVKAYVCYSCPHFDHINLNCNKYQKHIKDVHHCLADKHEYKSTEAQPKLMMYAENQRKRNCYICGLTIDNGEAYHEILDSNKHKFYMHNYCYSYSFGKKYRGKK